MSKDVEKGIKILSKKIVDVSTIFFDNIFRHFLTKKLKIFRPHFYPVFFDPCLQNPTTFAHGTCRMMLYFVEILLKKLLNYNSTIFFAKFRTRKLKNLQILTAFDKRMPSKFVELCRASPRQNSLDPSSCQFLSKEAWSIFVLKIVE